MESNVSASRSARRFLDDRVRIDWDYPSVPTTWSASDEEIRDAPDFRERYYADSDTGDSGNEAENGATSPYKFDSPDSIGDVVAQTRDARRRRRRDRLEREMQENEGLRIWAARRDLWTGATSVQKYGTMRHRARSTSPTAGDSSEDRATPPSSASPSLHTADLFDVVPVAPRLLSGNPIRASITPKAYSDIFQKIVVSSRTPSVPINLSDMTKALVQGWKDTDEWPPRMGVLDPLAGRKRSVAGVAVNGQHGGFMERHPHLEKSVVSVKRILHLNGHHENGEPGKER